MAKTLRIVLITIVGGLLAYSAWLAWSYYYRVEAERTPFSPVAWKEEAKVYAHSSDPGCVRGGMALDIIATDLLQGKLKDEVKSLLGDPDETKESSIYYELGQCSRFGWHDTVLQVNFSNRQPVTNATILRQLP